MSASIEQRVASLEQGYIALSQRMDMNYIQRQNPNHELSGTVIMESPRPQNYPASFSGRNQVHPYPQTYPYPYPLPPNSYRPQVPQPELGIQNSGWQAWSCCMLWFGLSTLLGGLGMLIPGALLLSSSYNCPNPYTYSNGQCCYSYSYYNYCYSLPISSSGIALLCVGFVGGVVGICLLVRACKFYRNNNEKCC